MRQRTVAQHATHRAALALTGDQQTANRVAATVTDTDRDKFLADPRGWLTSDVTLNVKCDSQTENAYIGHHGIHALSLTGTGPVLHDHPHLGETDLEALLVALGGPAPTCLLLAVAATSHGMVLPGHDDRFVGATRTPLLTVRYLAAARAWLADDADADLPALIHVLNAGMTPAGWDQWAAVGFSLATAKEFLRRGVPLAPATLWLRAALTTGRAAALAARGIPASQVTDLIAGGLTRTVALAWAETATMLTPAQVLALHRRGFSPSEGADAVAQVGFEAALTYGDLGLVTGRSIVAAPWMSWWHQFGADHETAAAWSELGFSASNAGYLADLRNADIDEEDEDSTPGWVVPWLDQAPITIVELAALAPLSYDPCELDGNPRPVDPDGRPIRWEDAIWLWRATGEQPAPWIAASAGCPEWDDNGQYLTTCWACPADDDGPDRCGHDVPAPDTGLPLVLDDPHLRDLYWSPGRARLVEAMCDAVAEGFPEEALPDLAAHGPINAAGWDYASALVGLLDGPDDMIAFLGSPFARVTVALDALTRTAGWGEVAADHVRQWQDAQATAPTAA